tara:strand:+ start:18355 stop:18531 length:177 start_codon:yes stop_codon:yes gene_type:complete
MFLEASNVSFEALFAGRNEIFPMFDATFLEKVNTGQQYRQGEPWRDIHKVSWSKHGNC